MVARVGVSLVLLSFVLCPTGAAEQEALLDEHVRRVQEEQRLPGVSAAVRLRDGRVVTAAAGYADSEARTPMTPRTRMPGGSTGKTFAAATTMLHVEEGRLALDAPLSRWLGGEAWFDSLPNAREITLSMLLSHTSGLPDHVEDLGFAASAAWRRLIGNDEPFSPVELVGFIGGERPISPAGAGYHYTDTGYVLVGLVLERVTGRPYYDELRVRILEPLELTDVAVPTSTSTERLAVGYVAPTLLTVVTGLVGRISDDEEELTHLQRMEFTGGGLFTTPAMLVHFFGALAEGRIVRPDTFERMMAPATGLERPYGYGIYVETHPDLGRWIGHGGWFPGFRTAVVHYLESGITVALQANSDREDIDLFAAVASAAAAFDSKRQ